VLALDPALLPEALVLTYVGVVGAIVGSFLNVVVARLPAGESLVRPRSRCPRCHAAIAWYDNIPVVSWLALRARCRACHAPIAVRYPLVELLGAALFLAVYARLGPSWLLILWLPLCAALLAVVFLDLDHFWVPDVITLPAMAWAFGCAFVPGGIGLVSALLGLVPALSLWAFAWLFERVTGREGMGLGDVKLLAVLGLALGPLGAVLALFLASLQGSLAGVLVLATGGHKRVEPDPAEKPATVDDDDWTPHPRSIPFGPFLVLACYELVLLPAVFRDLPLRWLGLAGEP
jgi:leader peptidase (prepilin peptidase)/N-methyltransferase